MSSHLVLLLACRCSCCRSCFRAVSSHLVLLQYAALPAQASVSEPCRATWFSYQTHRASSRCPSFRAVSSHLVLLPNTIAYNNLVVSEPCQITWFSYLLFGCIAGMKVSEPCQTTVFSYNVDEGIYSVLFQGRVRSSGSLTRCMDGRSAPGFRAVPNHLALLRLNRAFLASVQFQSRVKSPGSLTQQPAPSADAGLQSRVKSSGSLTQDGIAPAVIVFQSRAKSLSSLTNGCAPAVGCFRAVPGHLDLLQTASRNSRFRAVSNYLVLLTALKTSKSSPVSEPCQITYCLVLSFENAWSTCFFCFTTVPDRRARLPPWRGGIATSREPTDSVRGLSDV